MKKFSRSTLIQSKSQKTPSLAVSSAPGKICNRLSQFGKTNTEMTQPAATTLLGSEYPTYSFYVLNTIRH